MSEEMPNLDLRIISVIVKPGKDIEVSWEGFAPWEARAALQEAYQFIVESEMFKEAPEEGDDTFIAFEAGSDFDEDDSEYP